MFVEVTLQTIKSLFVIKGLGINMDRTTALGIGARRRKEQCAVECSTEARA